MDIFVLEKKKIAFFPHHSDAFFAKNPLISVLVNHPRNSVSFIFSVFRRTTILKIIGFQQISLFGEW